MPAGRRVTSLGTRTRRRLHHAGYGWVHQHDCHFLSVSHICVGLCRSGHLPQERLNVLCLRRVCWTLNRLGLEAWAATLFSSNALMEVEVRNLPHGKLCSSEKEMGPFPIPWNLLYT